MICVFSFRYLPEYVGGGERLARLTTRGFRMLGEDVGVVTTGGDGGKRVDEDGVCIEKVSLGDTGGPLGGGEEDVARLCETLARLQPSVLHIVDVVGSRVAAAGRRVGAARAGPEIARGEWLRT